MIDVRSTYTAWICSDCMQMLANGERADDAEQEPMRLLDGQEVSPGLMAEEHHEDCDLRNSSAAREAELTFGVPEGEELTYVHECNLGCEEKDFSHDRCDGCGGLPGERMAATVWERS